MALVQIALLCLLPFVASQMFDILRPKTIHIDKFKGVCPGYKNAPITFQNIKLQLKDRIQIVNMKVVYKEDVNEGLKLEIFMKRCQSREALDSCEKYQTIRLNHLCDLIQGDNKPWSPLVKMSDPPTQCPFKKGVSYIRNGTYDGSALSHLPFAGWYWIIEAHVLGETTNRVLMCVLLEGQIIPA